MARSTRIKAADPSKVVGYLRVSTDDQKLGPEAQRERLDAWCKANGAVLVAVLVDQGVSGGAAIADRPGLVAAIAALVEYGAGVLLVAKRDRLARDTMVAAMVERECERVGARVRTADGTGDGDGPESVLMRRMVDAFAEYERLLIAARTKAALAVKRARGERTGDVPYGWRLAGDGRQLEVNPEEQEVIRLVQAYRAEGLTLRAVAERLRMHGILPRSGRGWHPQTVARIAESDRMAA